jgi:SsrA-binding protein
MSSARGGSPPERRGRRADPKSLPKTVIATNRKARHDYAISLVVEAGLKLLGSEVKSLRNGSASLADGYARVEGDDVWLYGVHVPPLPQASYFNHEPRRKRLCLLHRREVEKVRALLEAGGTTMVPLSLHWRGTRAKVELGVGRGKREFDKRQDIRKREADRDLRRATRRG